MRTYLAAVAAALAVSVPNVATADKGDPPVPLNIDGPSADHRTCVTGGEWGRIDNPARSRTDLETLLDGPGTKQAGDLAGVWYPICGMSDRKGRVIITYDRGTVLDLAYWVVFQGQGSGFYRYRTAG